MRERTGVRKQPGTQFLDRTVEILLVCTKSNKKYFFLLHTYSSVHINESKVLYKTEVL